MSEKKILKLSKSIIVKSLLLLVSTMAVVTIGGTYYFAKRQTQMTLESADETNIIHLQQMSSTLHNELSPRQ